MFRVYRRFSKAVRAALAVVILIIAAAAGVTGASAAPIVACQSYFTAQIRIISDTTQECNRSERMLEFQSAADANQDVAALQAQIDAMGLRVTALEGRMDTAETDIDNLEGRMDTAETDVDNLEGRADISETDIDNLEGRMGTAETDIDNLEGRVDTAETNITNVDTRVTNIRNFFTGVANSINACFTDPNAVFSITIPEIEFPRIAVDLGDVLGTIEITPAFTLVPEITIGFPVFNATSVVSCLGGVATSTTQ